MHELQMNFITGEYRGVPRCSIDCEVFTGVIFLCKFLWSGSRWTKSALDQVKEDVPCQAEKLKVMFDYTKFWHDFHQLRPCGLFFDTNIHKM